MVIVPYGTAAMKTYLIAGNMQTRLQMRFYKYFTYAAVIGNYFNQGFCLLLIEQKIVPTSLWHYTFRKLYCQYPSFAQNAAVFFSAAVGSSQIP
jgi:hypothetical protein